MRKMCPVPQCFGGFGPTCSPGKDPIDHLQILFINEIHGPLERGTNSLL